MITNDVAVKTACLCSRGPSSVRPPALIAFWLTDGPFYLLMVTAVMFCVGLTLLAYAPEVVRARDQS